VRTRRIDDPGSSQGRSIHSIDRRGEGPSLKGHDFGEWNTLNLVGLIDFLVTRIAAQGNRLFCSASTCIVFRKVRI
jgi:hypothetical protein